MKALRALLLTAAFTAAALVSAPAPSAGQTRHTFELGREDFLLDGKPFLILGGEMHYARIPKEYWRHRLKMARAMGLNTVATYVFWNYHEPEPGRFDFTTENRDLAGFIRTAAEEGLRVIVRPGPYACAEWDFGGYPWWLLREDGLVVRGTDPRFLEASRAYLKRLGEEIAPLLVTRGGPVIMVQVENEYGSYGADTSFMAAMRDAIIGAGFDVPLFTADGPSQCRNGHIAGVLPAINGDDAPQSLRDTVRRWNGGSGPFFSPEFYPGWLDHWGEQHSTRPSAQVAERFERLVADGISVNLYMFHGGTNFGFTNGANYGGRYQPQPTSYDYDAPLDEAGRPTPKYDALREVLRRRLAAGGTLPEPPPPIPVIALPDIRLQESAPVFGMLPAPVLSEHPVPMEKLGQGEGYTLYRTILPAGPGGDLVIGDLRDYAVVFLDGRKVGSLDRRHRRQVIALPPPRDSAALDILVENGGRINYGPRLTDNRKGITREVRLSGRVLTGWKMVPLPFRNADSIFAAARWSAGGDTGGIPLLRRGEFSVTKPGDTFLDMGGWGKGCVWVNGRNLGRFWSIGPQQTLYLPGVWLREGRNEVVVLEIENTGARRIRGLTEPILDSLGTDELAPPRPERAAGLAALDAGDVVQRGFFEGGDSLQTVLFRPVKARFLALESLSSLRDDPFASAAELYLLDERGERLDRAEWKIASVESEEIDAEDGRAENVFDGDPETIWHTKWGTSRPPHPHHLVIDLGSVRDVAGFGYLPRSGNAPGKIREYRLYLRREPFSKK